MVTENEADQAEPVGGPASFSTVKSHLKIGAEDTADDAALKIAVDAVNDFCSTLRLAAEVTEGQWPPRAVQGATMLASRLWRRRNSPAGVEAFAAAGALYVRRDDPDVAMLLGLGEWSTPGVG